jgi:hypothetical protein
MVFSTRNGKPEPDFLRYTNIESYMKNQSQLSFIDACRSIHDEIDRLTRHFLHMWWQSGTDFPEFTMGYSTNDHRCNDLALQQAIRQVSAEMEQQAKGSKNAGGSRGTLQKIAAGLMKQVLGFEDRHVALVLDNGFFDIASEFARRVRDFDPGISDDDIYQAARNVMTMNFMQLLLQRPVSLTDSVFAYSLLYPLTDNYLDGDSLSTQEKKDFSARFRRRLLGEKVNPANAREEQIWCCMQMMEDEYPRKKYPLVHASLLGINDTQVESLALLRRDAAPYEVDVPRLTFAKGGAAVLADGYLVAGDLDEGQRLFMFAYGAFTQLIDDLEDTRRDRREGVLTVFSQSSGKWELDTLTNRLFRFGSQAFQTVDYFKGAQVQTLREMIWKCIDPLLIDMASRNRQDYSRLYPGRLEKHFPFSYRGLHQQRKRLEKRHFHLMDLVRAFAR